MKIKREIVEAKYEIVELSQQEFECLISALNRAKDFWSRDCLMNRHELKGAQLEEMKGYEKMLEKINF